MVLLDFTVRSVTQKELLDFHARAGVSVRHVGLDGLCKRLSESKVKFGQMRSYVNGYHCCLANLRIMSAGYKNRSENFSANSSQTLYLKGFSQKS